MKRTTALFAATLLTAISVVGLWHGARAFAAQTLYYRAKFGADKTNPSAILRLCDNARRLYPFNYYFCIFAAETAFYARPGDTPEEDRTRLADAGRWCDAAMRLNPYRSQVRLLKARLLAVSSPAAAAAFWARYVDWNFWEPNNHAVLAEFYAQAGDFDKAMASLKWAKDSKYYADAEAKVREAWKREREPPRVPRRR